MGRRKIPCTVQLQSGGAYESQTSENVCSLEFLQQKYDQATSNPRPTKLYETTTIYHVERIKRLFTEYCDLPHHNLDPRQTLEQCDTARIENFLHWILQTYTIKKTSTVTTYWRQLSQLHIVWTYRRIEPNILKQIFVFIEGPLTEEYHLDNTETEKPLLEADEFVEVIEYHWASDINVFPNERQRVQLAAILLLAAFTGSRPSALLSLTYRDLHLYVDRDSKTGEHALRLGVTLSKTKSRQKRKRVKTYTFNLDENPIFCIIAHIIVLAFDDEAFAVPELLSPKELFRLRAKQGNGCTSIPWKQEKLDIPIFRRAIMTKQGVQTSDHKALPYNIFHPWVVRLGEALGYLETLTTYCLRRALGNAINDDPNSNAAIRNLTLDHTGSHMFERNYLSRMIRYSTQDAFWGRTPNHDSAQAASRIGHLRDPNRPRKLTEEQRQQVLQDPQIRKLTTVRNDLQRKIVAEFGVVKMAVGEPIHKEYLALGRRLNSTIRAEERALLKQIQAEYDVTAPVLEIQRQLNGEGSDDEESTSEAEPILIKLTERRRIAEAALADPSISAGRKGFRRHIDLCLDMIALCKRRERQERLGVKKDRSQNGLPVKRTIDSIRSPKSEPEEKRTTPLQCKGFQCLYCLQGTLPLTDGQKVYKDKYDLKRHVDRCRLKQFQLDDPIPCPDGLACNGVVLDGKTHFKRHAAEVHNFWL